MIVASEPHKYVKVVEKYVTDKKILVTIADPDLETLDAEVGGAENKVVTYMTAMTRHDGDTADRGGGGEDREVG